MLIRLVFYNDYFLRYPKSWWKYLETVVRIKLEICHDKYATAHLKSHVGGPAKRLFSNINQIENLWNWKTHKEYSE